MNSGYTHATASEASRLSTSLQAQHNLFIHQIIIFITLLHSNKPLVMKQLFMVDEMASMEHQNI